MWVHELMSFLYISSKGYLITLGHFRCYHVQSLWPSQSTKKYDISILLYLCILKSLHYIWKCIFLTLYPKYWVKEISFGSKLPLALSAFKTICSLCVSSVLANCIYNMKMFGVWENSFSPSCYKNTHEVSTSSKCNPFNSTQIRLWWKQEVTNM